MDTTSLKSITPQQIVAALAYGSGSNHSDAILKDRRELRRLEEIRQSEYPAYKVLETIGFDRNEIEGRLDAFNALIDLAEPAELNRPKRPEHIKVLNARGQKERNALKALLQSITPEQMSSTLRAMNEIGQKNMPKALCYLCFRELLKMVHWEIGRSWASPALKAKLQGKTWMLLAVIILAEQK